MIGRSTLKKVTCTETCQEDGCNTGWRKKVKVVLVYHVSVCQEQLMLKNRPETFEINHTCSSEQLLDLN